MRGVRQHSVPRGISSNMGPLECYGGRSRCASPHKHWLLEPTGSPHPTPPGSEVALIGLERLHDGRLLLTKLLQTIDGGMQQRLWTRHA